MVNKDFEVEALKILQQTIIQARFWSYKKEDQVKIAKLLDAIEILPSYLYSNENQTEDFIDTVKSVAKGFDGCKYLLEMLPK